MSSGNTDRKRAVPKFASFRPKPPSDSDSKPDSKGESKPGLQAQSRGRDAEDLRTSQGNHQRKSRHHVLETGNEKDGRRREYHSSSNRVRKSPSPLRRDERNTPTSGSSNNVFYIDKRGDPLILRYGSIDRSKVPSYHRFGAGRVMGADGLLSLHYDRSRPEFTIQARHRGGGSIFRDKKALSAIGGSASANPKYIRPPRHTQGLPTDSDNFIPLSRKRKRGEEGLNSLPDYRSIYTKASDSGSDSEETSSDDEDAGDERTTSKQVQLSRQLKVNPEDVEVWLQYIELQDSVFREHRGATTGFTAEEAKGLSDIKSSLYEKALANVTRIEDKERLLLGLMREGAKVWDEKTLAKRWDDVTKDHGDRFLLWRERLNFELSRVASCTYEVLRQFITGRLRMLINKLQETSAAKSNEDTGELCSELIYVFLRLTRFLADAGYSELATAAWQAVLELTFYRPRELSEAEEDGALSSFSEFWESEAPRIGEPGSKGWQEFVDNEGMTDPPDPRPGVRDEPPSTRDKFKAWGAIESERATRLQLPARTLDEGTEDDPYRVVMFSDIRDLLIWFPTAAAETVGPQLLDAFTIFCGLPSPRLSTGLVDSARNDPLVAGRSEAFEIALSETGSPDKTRRTPEFRHQGSSMATSQDVLFSGMTWFRYLDDWHTMGWSEDWIAWVLGTLEQLVKNCKQEQLAEYYIAAAWRNEPATIRKVAKALLKQYSSNTRLYSAYALIEFANGNLEVSEKVLSAATNQGLSATTSSQLLFNTWAWIYIESNQAQTALSRLCLSVDRNLGSSTPSTTSILKAKSHFSSTRDYALSSHDLPTALHHAESLLLLTYLTAQDNLSLALSTLSPFTADLTTRNLSHSPTHELLLQSAARLIHHHTTLHPHQPSTIRTHLLSFLHFFPTNAIFLTLLSHHLPPISLPLNNPLLTTLQSTLTTHHDSLSTHRFLITYLLRTNTIHSFRAAFEDALDSPACKGNVDLWVRYVRFCLERKELRGTAKRVFYRALGACPMAKGVYMEGFRDPLVKEMGSAELRGVGEAMVEKGVRVRVDLEDWLRRWEGEREGAKDKERQKDRERKLVKGKGGI